MFLLLQDNGFEVYLVNAKHIKNVTGRKDDESDAEWIQKALELMNIKLHTIISDIDGKTGSLIIEAILAGERDPEVLADLRDGRIKASREDIIKSLEGHWTSEHLFELKQCYQLYCTHRHMIDDCDKEIEKQMIEQIASKNEGLVPDIPEIKRKVSGKKHKVSFNLTGYLKEILKVDVTEIFGISEISALTILSEVGTDMSKWKTGHHFTSWLGLAPNTKISGGKVISSKIMKKKHHAGQAFRIAANSLSNSKSPLGDHYRRIRAKAGAAKAVVATARKIAIIYYKMVVNKEAFNPKALEDFQKKYKEKKINQLKRKIALIEAA